MKLQSLLIGSAIATLALTSCGSETKDNEAQGASTEEVSKPAEAVAYAVDASASTVSWKGGKVFSEEGHNGTIDIQSGSVSVLNGAVVGGEIVIAMDSIRVLDITAEQGAGALVGHFTGKGTNRDGSPQTNDFFNTAEFPTASFVITEVKENEVTGNLTVKGKTLPYSFPATVKAEGDMVSVKGSLVFDRSKFGVEFGTAAKLGPLDKLEGKAKNHAIKNEIELGLDIVAKK